MSSTSDAASAPIPPDVFCAADPLFALLSSFPVPQLLAAPAPFPSTRVDNTRSDRNSKYTHTPHTTDIDEEILVDAITTASRAMLSSGTYETLRRAAGDSDDGFKSMKSSEGNEVSSPLSSLALSVHEKLRQLESAASDVDVAVPTCAPPVERWARHDSPRMSLRHRPPPDAPTGRGHCKSEAPQDDAPPPEIVRQAEVDAARRQAEVFCAATPADVILGGSCDAASLRRLRAMLPGACRPFDGVPLAAMTSFLAALALPPGAGEVPDEAMARAAACGDCVAHPAFDPAALAEDTVEHLLALLASVVRRATRRLREESVVWRGEPECLRAMLNGLAGLVCEHRIHVCSDGDLLRLEEMSFECLVAVPAAAPREAAADYTAHVTAAAAALYRAVWNRLETQRDATAVRFFARFAQHDGLLLRHFTLPNSGIAVMGITTAILTAAQSVPIVGPITRAAAVRLQEQCRHWAGRVVDYFVSTEHRGERRDRDIFSSALLQLCEDLAQMLGEPEYPAADPLLRALLAALSTSASDASPATLERMRVLFVDAVFRIAQVVCKSESLPEFEMDTSLPQAWLKLTHVTKQTGAVEKVFRRKRRHRKRPRNGRVGGNSGMKHEKKAKGADKENENENEDEDEDEEVEEEDENENEERKEDKVLVGRRGVKLEPSACEDEDDLYYAKQPISGACGHAYKGDRKDGDHTAHGGDTPELDLGDQCRAVLYFALSRCVAEATDRIISASWHHTRAAHVLCWALHDPKLTDDVVDSLVRDETAAAVTTAASSLAGAATLWPSAVACARRLCAMGAASLFGPAGCDRLAAALIAPIRAHDGPGADAARLRAAGHAARLARLYPPLLQRLWPAARRCARDERAKVREAAVALLAALLDVPGDVDAGALAALLLLLRDRSAAVVARAISALDSILTGSSLNDAPELLAFTQARLLALLASGPRHRGAVARLFVRRWAPDAADPAAHRLAAERAAAELARLASDAAPFPHETPGSDLSVGGGGGLDEAPLIILLREMALLAEGPTRRGAMAIEVDTQTLRGAMIGTAKALWATQRRLTPTPAAVAALAALYALAAARAEWVEPLLAALTQFISNPPVVPTPTVTAPTELGMEVAGFTGAVLLHMCRILRAVLLSPQPPNVALDDVAKALTALLGRYVGPHQHRVLVAACGALTATITCGADQLDGRANARYLALCYGLMNTYYVRTRVLLQTLRSDPRGVAYTLRFLFLLSEFLRQYPGWRQPHSELAETEAAAGVPNQLAKGDGICGNVYSLVEEVLSACPTEAHGRTALITLRVLASLCMLQPSIFFYRCESHLRHALDPHNGDTALQAQGLALVRDFLIDEDARVERAAARHTRVPPAEAMKGDSRQTSSASKQGRERNGTLKRERKRLAELHSPSAGVEEQNSGMAAWAMQRFHAEILQLCESGALPVRQTALEVLRLSAQGGLLPPSHYIAAVAALAADPYSEAVRQLAAECLTSTAERYEDVVGSCAFTAVTRAFDLHIACGVEDLVSSAITSATFADNNSTMHNNENNDNDSRIGNNGNHSPSLIDSRVESIHAGLFAVLRKRHRDGLVSALLRFLHSDARATQWMREHTTTTTNSFTSRSKGSRTEPITATAPSPFSFLCHIALTLAVLPYTGDGDVRRVVDGCRTVIDLAAQSCSDFVDSFTVTMLSPKTGTTKSDTKSRTQTIEVELWKCCGVLCAARVQNYLRRVFHITNEDAKLKPKQKRRPHEEAYEGRGSAAAAAAAALVRELVALAKHMAPLWPLGNRNEAVMEEVVEHLRENLAQLLREESRMAITETPGGAVGPRRGGRKAVKGTKQQRRRLEESFSSKSSSSSDSESESELETESAESDASETERRSSSSADASGETE